MIHRFRLYLMRHGHAEYGFGKSDYERELSYWGIQQVHAISNWFFYRYPTPPLFLVSPILRAQQTFLHFVGNKLNAVHMETTESLTYHSSPDQLLPEIMAYEKTAIFCIGHQPLLGDFIDRVTNGTVHVPVETASITCFDTELEQGKMRSRFLWHETPDEKN